MSQDATPGVEELFDLYTEAFRDGQPDPRPFLKRVDGEEKDELESLITLFLESSASRAFDPGAFAGSKASKASDQIAARLLTPRGGWAQLLPALRIRRGLKRAKIESMLSKAVGAETPEQQELVAHYYHNMEQGNLPPSGVSNTVIDTLADVLKASADLIRRAGSATVPKESAGMVFMRAPGHFYEWKPELAEDKQDFDAGPEHPPPALPGPYRTRDEGGGRQAGSPKREELGEIDRYFIDPESIEAGE
jgi:hypothetical protein